MSIIKKHKKLLTLISSTFLLGQTVLMPTMAYADVYVYKKNVKDLIVMSPSSNGGSSPGDESTSGQGVLTLSSSSITMPSTPVGQATNASIIVQNTGSASLALTYIPTSGSSFASTTSCGSSLAAGQSCSVLVSFTPTATGSFSGSLTVNSHSVTLNGAGINASGGLLATESLIDFGTTQVGYHVDKIINFVAQVPVANAQINVLNNNELAVLPTIVSNNCVSSTGVQNCSITLRYTPTNTANAEQLDAALVVSAPEFNDTVLNLTGTSSFAHVGLAPDSGNSPQYLDTLINSTKSQTFKFTNYGYSTVNNVYAAFNNALTVGADPVINEAATTCGKDSAHGIMLVQGGSCNIVVSYSPTNTSDILNSTLVVSNQGGDQPQIALQLTGNAVASDAVSEYSTASISFTDANVGDTSVSPKAIKVFNTGEASLGISSIGVTGTDASSYTATTNCSTSLTAGSNCTVNVTFKPTTSGTKNNASVVFETSVGSYSVSLSGTANSIAVGSTLIDGVVPAYPSFTTSSSTDFVGASKVQLYMGDTLMVASSAVSYSPNNGGGGTLTATFNNLPAANTYKAYVYNGSNAVIGSASVTIGARTASLMGSSSVFSTVPGAPLSRTYTFTNSGTLPLSGIYANLGSLVGATSSEFYISTNSCGTSVAPLASLAAGANCTLVVTFNPSAAEPSISGLLTLTSNATNSASNTLILTGSATQSEGVLAAASGYSTNFGAVNLGSSASTTLTYTATGGTDTIVKGGYLSGTPLSPDIAITSTTCGSTNSPVTLSSGQSCDTVLTYTPSSSSGLSVYYVMTTDAKNPQSYQQINLSGTSNYSYATLTGSSAGAGVSNLNFGSYVVGASIPNVYWTFKNSGQLPMTLSVASLSNPFTIVSNNCTNIAYNNSCSIYASMSASQAYSSGSVTLNITGSSTLANKLLGYQVTGTVSSPTYTVALTSNNAALNFGTNQLGQTVANQTWTFTNTGNSNTNITFSVPAPFSLKSTTCTTSFAPNATCTAVIGMASTSLYSSGAKAISVYVHSSPTSLTGYSATGVVNPNSSGLVVTSASYGYNVGAPSGNRTSYVQSVCTGGVSPCTIAAGKLYSAAAGGDPATGKAKNLYIDYSCGGVAHATYYMDAEAGTKINTISCP